jgi:hypothetical protein
MRKYLVLLLILALLPLVLTAQNHTKLMGLPLSLTPAEMVAGLMQRQVQQVTSREMSGYIAGLNVWLTIGAQSDTASCDYIRLSTQCTQGLSQHEDYNALMHWMKKHYGWPDWEATVRSHSFARWFVDFDRDIVMISKASSAVEIWFYENHEKRDFDYYAILKYCERHPVPGVPHLTAQECVVWKSTTPSPEVRKSKVKGKSKRASRKSPRKATAKRRSRRR